MDVAYPVGRQRRNPDQLIWSIRSVCRHFPVDRIFIAGQALPPGLDPDCERLVFLKTEQTQTKFWNIGENLEAVLNSDISHRFLWMNDDFFFLQSFGEDSLPIWVRNSPFDVFCHRLARSVQDRPRSDEYRAYVNGMIGQRAILARHGISTKELTNTDAHTPIMLEKTWASGLVSWLKRDYPKHPTGHFRALYGWGGAVGEVTVLRDPKIMNVVKLPEPGVPLVSTNDKSWVQGKVGEWLRERFDVPSPFERVGDRAMARR